MISRMVLPWKRVVFALVPSVLAYFAAELGRAVAFRPAAAQYHDVTEDAPPPIGFRYRPNLRAARIRWLDTDYHLTTDAQGWRVMRPGARRFVGDSFVAGCGVEAERCFVSLLGGQARACGGWGLLQIEQAIPTDGPAVLCLYANDLQRVGVPSRGPWFRAEWTIAASILRHDPPSSDVRYSCEVHPEFERRYQAEAGAILERILARMRPGSSVYLFPSKKSAHAARVRARWPDELDAEERALGWAAGLARGAGFPCRDLTPEFRASFDAGRDPYYRLDGHWNELGHEIAARCMTDAQ